MPLPALVLILAGQQVPLKSFRYDQATHTATVNGVAYSVSPRTGKPHIASLRFTAHRLDLSGDTLFRAGFGIPN